MSFPTTQKITEAFAIAAGMVGFVMLGVQELRNRGCMLPKYNFDEPQKPTAQRHFWNPLKLRP